LGAEREEIALRANLKEEPDCRGDLWWRGGGWVNSPMAIINTPIHGSIIFDICATQRLYLRTSARNFFYFPADNADYRRLTIIKIYENQRDQQEKNHETYLIITKIVAQLLY